MMNFIAPVLLFWVPLTVLILMGLSYEERTGQSDRCLPFWGEFIYRTSLVGMFLMVLNLIGWGMAQGIAKTVGISGQ